MISQQSGLPVAVIGAGPIGLAAAAHLVQRGLTPLILEAGASVASSFESFRHVALFSPWRYNIDRAARELLEETGWQAPDAETLPTAGDMIDRYLTPLSQLPVMAPHLLHHHKVVQISRLGMDKVKTAGREQAPFVLRVRTPQGMLDVLAQAVIDATGTWAQPNPLGANGLPATNEDVLAAHVTYGMPDILGAARTRYAGKRVLVIGAGHSAAGNLIALAELAKAAPGTSIVWAIRGNDPQNSFGGGDADGLQARGRLGLRLQQLQQSGQLELRTQFRIQALRERGGAIDVHGEPIAGKGAVIEAVDEIIAATGSRPNLDMTRELRLRLDPLLETTDALAPLIDPNLHSCGTVRPHGHRELQHPETGYYAVGAKSYGRAPNFLLATGYEQVRSVVAALAGDMRAADAAQLDLPETGVCSVQLGTGDHVGQGQEACCGGPASQPAQVNAEAPAASEAGCCGGPAPESADACCLLDAQEKAKGAAGCGCGQPQQRTQKGEAAACCG